VENSSAGWAVFRKEKISLKWRRRLGAVSLKGKKENKNEK
jgi:hypothetical protein